MRTSVHLATIAGIRIDVNFSWLIIFALLTFSLATSWFPTSAPHQPVALYWLTAVVAVILLFASVIAHELAHSLVARARGLPVKSITLFIFGGVSNIEREPQSAGVEFQMAFVGPLTSIVLGGVFLSISLLLSWISTPPILLTALLTYAGVVNLLLGVFNLIPGFPMDGGRVLRAILWRASGSLAKATQWASRVGQVVAYLMIMTGIWLFFVWNALDGLWIGFVGLFLLQAAQAESAQSQLEASIIGVTVGDVMTSAPTAVTPDLTAQQFVDEHLLRNGQRALPVVENFETQRLLGIVTLRDVRGLARERWPITAVSQIMTPLAQLTTVDATQPLSDAIPRLRQAGVNQLPVVRDGRLVGLLDLEAVLRLLAVRRSLGMSSELGAGKAAHPTNTRPPQTFDAPATTRLPTTA